MSFIKVVAGVVVKDKKILIARKRKGKSLAGLWEFPGGKIEADEIPEIALKRELLEEFCIEVQVGNYIETSFYHYPRVSIELKAYYATYLSGKIILTDHDCYRWIKPEELQQFEMAPADLPFLKLIESNWK
ncbi:MAG: (deoxy)nucleoside triphosphate pyrophosphohydrolase [Flammeovirgaceae bacterium]|nr:(deoxy)nucleoside triphosphate pyrophosphohydrolase [Flammeovirgaceae bacterium]